MTKQKVKITDRCYTVEEGTPKPERFRSITAARCAFHRVSGHIYRTWFVVTDGGETWSESELIWAYGESVCNVKRADEILLDRITNKYHPSEIIIAR